jgi:hypothetical protein
MQDSFKSLLESAKSILVVLPTNPKFDEVAAGLSFYLAFKGQKEIAVFSPSEMVVAFNRLVGVNRIVKEIGNKNLTIRFVNYDAEGIEKVSYDIKNGEFQLTVVPKVGVPSPQENQVQKSYSGVATDTVFLIGGQTDKDFPLLANEDLQQAKVVHFGISALETLPGRIISLARPASSVSELTATLIKESGLQIDADMATNLLMGIDEGTKGFSEGQVTADTFSLIAELMRAGGKRMPKVESIPSGQFVSPATPRPPKSWLEPKIYKGTSVS